MAKNDSEKITIGDLFWDENREWTEGEQTLNMVHLVLSRDRAEDGLDYWKLARFMWCTPGYCGANLDEFTDAEVLKMTKVGNIADIKAFPEEPNDD